MQQSYGGTPMAPPPAPAQYPPPAPAQVPPAEQPRKAGSGKALGGVAIALGAAAIALALVGMFMFPGPAGETGPQGEKGDTGDTGTPGTNGINGINGLHCWDLNGNGIKEVATEDTNLDGVVDILDCKGEQGTGSIMAYAERVGTDQITGCLNYLSVTINAPGVGSVVLISSAHAWIDHTTGTTDMWYYMVRETATDCNAGFTDPTTSIVEVSAGAPTDGVINVASALTNMYTVTGAGAYTYYLNTEMGSGESATDTMVNASIVAIFYPS